MARQTETLGREMNSRPLIGITTSDHKSFLAWACDRLAVWRAGGQPVRLSPSREIPEGLAGLMIGGGDDIGAQLYGGEVRLDVRVDPARDRLELALLERFLPQQLPVLGICRGAQIINVHCGGTLIGDIYTTYDHVRRQRTVLPRKQVDIATGSRLHTLLGVSRCRVNSLHHQAVDRLGDTLHVVARDRNGLIQAIEAPECPYLVGVQWHPEFLVFNRPQQRLIRGLVDAARER
ncbi:gamma-glutamyl-gamma-aminobutyrate hydrolase family protein [Chromohalobacter canadensis]|nr:type 1 glutamine amidotransferase [Chromohalobacter canadensis]